MKQFQFNYIGIEIEVNQKYNGKQMDVALVKCWGVVLITVIGYQ
jgi:hypothetical protein